MEELGQFQVDSKRELMPGSAAVIRPEHVGPAPGRAGARRIRIRSLVIHGDPEAVRKHGNEVPGRLAWATRQCRQVNGTLRHRRTISGNLSRRSFPCASAVNGAMQVPADSDSDLAHDVRPENPAGPTDPPPSHLEFYPFGSAASG